MKLILPNTEMRPAFERMVRDYWKNEEWEYYYKYADGLEDMEEYVERIRLDRLGIDLPEELVATTLYWLVDEDEKEIRGNLRIRHVAVPIHGNIGYDIPPSMRMKGYGREILKLAVKKAKRLGMKEVKVTCARENEASRRIIEANGGRFLGEGVDEGEIFLQYRIDL